MGTDGRVLVFWKLALDVLVGVGIICSFGVHNLTYMRDFSFSVFGVRYRFTYLTLDAYSLVDYSDFKTQYCVQPKEDYTEICDWLRTFNVAGLCYFIVCTLVLLMLVYNVVSELSLMVYCNCQVLRSWKSLHYVQPFFYLIAVLLYALISNIFFLRPPTGKSQDYEAQALFGAWLMAVILVLCTFSSLYFLAIGDSVKRLEMASSPAYQALVAHALDRQVPPGKAVDA